MHNYFNKVSNIIKQGGITMRIDKNMTIGEVVIINPNFISILSNFGMGCVGCPSAQAETLEEAAQVHGINIDELIKALNQ